jgi:TctA family transporter
VVTCIDGYQIGTPGTRGPALAIAAIGSFCAGTIAIIIAMFAPPLAEMVLKFNAPEYFSLMLMGLVAAAVLGPGRYGKGTGMVIMGAPTRHRGNGHQFRVCSVFTSQFMELCRRFGSVIIRPSWVFAVGEIISNLI